MNFYKLNTVLNCKDYEYNFKYVCHGCVCEISKNGNSECVVQDIDGNSEKLLNMTVDWVFNDMDKIENKQKTTITEMAKKYGVVIKIFSYEGMYCCSISDKKTGAVNCSFQNDTFEGLIESLKDYFGDKLAVDAVKNSNYQHENKSKDIHGIVSSVTYQFKESIFQFTKTLNSHKRDELNKLIENMLEMAIMKYILRS